MKFRISGSVAVFAFASLLGTPQSLAQNAYITNQIGTVSVIATERNTVIATIPVGAEPGGVAVAPDGAKVYVANTLSDNMSIIAAASNTVTATIAAGVKDLYCCNHRLSLR
jgi:YVTN family beta-propeller protein